MHFIIKEFDKSKLAMREQQVDFKNDATPQPVKMMTQPRTYGNTESKFTSINC